MKNRCSFGPLRLHAVLLLLWAPLLPACGPEIGDSCATALDCSASGTRLCDLTQNGGYCTLDGCEKDTCPPESVCVQFGKLIDDAPVDRLSRTFCMYKCKKSNDCREDEGYACFSADGFGAGSREPPMPEARVLGPADQKFCAVEPPIRPDESMMSKPDAGMMSMPDDDAGN